LPPAVRLDPDPRPDESTVEVPGAVGLDKISTSADEHRNTKGQTTQEVARFEELLTPQSNTVDEELAYRRADAAGDAPAATNLGVLLEQKGDRKGAVAAYRRADRRGDVNGSFNLGCLLAELGDVTGAVAALRRADERGDPAAASNLGVLLEQQGDLCGALNAYQRADNRGDANGSFNLGLLLSARGDLAGARAAYQRAAEKGDAEVGERARSALQELNGDPGS
jgi:tetratricopeptide (TPR) repeat protein